MLRRITVMLMGLVFAAAVSTGVLSLPETRIYALYQEPNIDVVIPSSVELVLNPRRLPVKITGSVSSSNEPIVNVPWSIVNRSNVGIKVDAVVSGTVASRSTMELSETPVGNYRGEDKRIFLYLDRKVTDPDVDLQTGLNWTGSVYRPGEDILITEDEEEWETIMILAPAKLDGSVAPGGVGAFHLNGDVTPEPEEEWIPGIDGVIVKIVFSFRPTDYSRA